MVHLEGSGHIFVIARKGCWVTFAWDGVLASLQRHQKALARFQQILRLLKPFRLFDSSMPVIIKVTYW